MEKSLAETIILDAQLRGERSIAKARFLLMAVLTAFAVYVFVSASSERGLSTELARPVYYIEFLSIALCLVISAAVLKITSRGVYSAWMRYLPSLVDVSSIAAIHVSMATANNPCYSFCGATVWLYVLFIAVSSLRNSPASVLATGVYAAFAFFTINVFSYADMGNFVPGRNVYSNGAGNLVKLDFEDEIIKATVILAVTGILAVVCNRNMSLLRKQIELQETTERYADTLKRINNSLERFIPREFLGFLGKENILEVELGDWKECRMTIFFLDIRDFTALSENMSPQDNFKFLNSFLGVFGPIVRAHGGFVDKYPGDGIMALFPGESDGAIDAALEMKHKLDEYNADRARAGYEPISVGIGMHSGPLMLGTIGENNRMDSTVISDAVNTASRIEELTKKFAKIILLSGDVLACLARPKSVETRFVAEEKVKGKANAVHVFELVGRSDSMS